MDPFRCSLRTARDDIRAGTYSAKELTTWYLQRIQKYNSGLHAFISVAEDAMEQAERIDSAREAGLPLGPLAGVPIAIKDLIDTADQKTTYGSLLYKNHQPNQDATIVKRLRDAGAILIGKTNLHEFAYGTTSENPHYGNAVNPWNRSKVSGGSSGGSAVAVSAGLALAAIGTDTGGSIRIPASLTGVVGLKPTFGLVSKQGVYPLAPSLDHVGPMTRTVDDAALLLQVIYGCDPKDPWSLHTPVTEYSMEAEAPVVVGVPKRYFFDRCHPNVLASVGAAIQEIERAGVEVIEIDIPGTESFVEVQSAILNSEALYVHKDQFEKNPSLYGVDLRQRLENAGQIRGHEYVRAQFLRNEFVRNIIKVFDEIDVLLTPTTPLVATDVGQSKAHLRMQEVDIRRHLTRYTSPWNFSGLPALSLPCAVSSDGLPVGLQLVGPKLSEQKLLAYAAWVEQRIGWNAIAPDYRRD